MNPETRNQFIPISKKISVISQNFINNTATVPHSYMNISVEKLDNDEVSSVIFNQLSKDITWFYHEIPCSSSNLFILLRTYQNEGIRCKMWTASHRSLY